MKEVTLVEGSVNSDHRIPSGVGYIMENYIVNCSIIGDIQSASVLKGVIDGRFYLDSFNFKEFNPIRYPSAVEPLVDLVEFRALIFELYVNLLLTNVLN